MTRMHIIPLAVVFALLALIPFAGTAPAAAQRQVDEMTYESPTYGYTLTFDPTVWKITIDDEHPDDRFDHLSLSNGPSLVSFIGDPTGYAADLDACINDYTAAFAGLDGVGNLTPNNDRPATVVGGPGVSGTYDYAYALGDGATTDGIYYVECRPLANGATLIVEHITQDGRYQEEIAARQDLLTGLSLSGEGGDEAGMVVYQSPTYGYTLTFDSAVWEVVVPDVDEDDGVDTLNLTNGPSLVMIISDPNYAAAPPQRCVDDYVERVRYAESTISSELVDRGGTGTGGLPVSNWELYTYAGDRNARHRDGAFYVECRWAGGDLMIVIIHEAPAGQYDREVAARDNLLAGLDPAS